MPNDDNGEYRVGYGKPPTQSRFEPGRSGNPKGRPKGSKNSSTLLNDALDEKVTIKERGRQKRITKREAAFKQFANKAASGDPRAIQLLMNELRQMQARPDSVPTVPTPLQDNELEIVAELIKWAREGGDDDGDEGTD